MKNLTLTAAELPRHVAIIMDGNGTWAKKRGLPRNAGHRQGAQTLLDIVTYSQKIGLKYLTVFAFSTENWSRPKEEVDYLMKLSIKFIDRYQERFLKADLKFTAIGNIDGLPAELQTKISEFENKSRTNQGLHFIIAINYGGHEEITSAVKAIVASGETMITEQTVRDHLYTKDIPDVDLLIRTSGQMRLSNFLLWQCAYSEFYFTKVLWPDFNEEKLNEALEEYKNRDRRFGGIK